MASGAFRFSSLIIQPSVIFFRTKLSVGFVNIKPVLPGHVLVAPIRIVKRFAELTEDEVSDLFVSTQKIAGVVEKEFGGTSLTISIQDGPEAGQSVEHVHVHVLPRKQGDFERNDEIYKALAEHDKPDLQKDWNGTTIRKGLRSEEEMEKEASLLAEYFK